MSCLDEWAAVRWGPLPTPVDHVVIQPQIQGSLWCVVSLWWHGSNMIMIPNLKTYMIPLWLCKLGCRAWVMTWVQTYSTPKKKHVHGVGCREQHMCGTTIKHVCLLCNINKYIATIHMLLENTVTYKNVTPTYKCCLKNQQYTIKSQYYIYVV